VIGLLLAGCGPAPEWELVASEVPGGVMLSAFTRGDEVVLAGGSYGATGSLWRYDGASLCVEEDVADGALWWIHGRSPTDVWMVGDRGIVIHEVERQRTREDLPDDGLTNFGVYDDGTAVWVVAGAVRGDQTGQIWRRDEAGDWEKIADTPGLAFKVHERWFVGDGFAWRWTGTEFEDLTPEGAPRLLTVRGRAPDDVWAVGGLQAPEFWHFDGTAWSRPELDPTCVGQALNGVVTGPDGAVHLAGNSGLAATYEADGSYTCAEVPLTPDSFHAVWTFEDEVLAIGGNLFATSDHHATLARFPARGELPFDGACGR